MSSRSWRRLESAEGVRFEIRDRLAEEGADEFFFLLEKVETAA